MKNELKYYYNLTPKDIYNNNNIYKFSYNNNYYALIELQNIDNIEYLYKLSIDLNNNGIYTHQIILNNFNRIVTNINNKNYTLIKSIEEYNKKVTLNDIVYFSNITSNIINMKKINWHQLWCDKMDYFEYQVDELKKRYPIIKESFKYFSGIVETGISLLINEKYNNYSLSICHNRINKEMTLFDLYNPLNFMIDVKIRDVCEYFKKENLDNNTYNEIINYLNYNNLTDDEIKLFFIRMLYPSFYFDLYEKIILNNENENAIYKAIDRIDNYELIIKKIYIFIKKIYIFPEVEWLN